MNKFIFYYYVGGFYDCYKTFELELNNDDVNSLIIIANCPLGRSTRAFVNLECSTPFNYLHDENLLIKNRIDYCKKFNYDVIY